MAKEAKPTKTDGQLYLLSALVNDEKALDEVSQFISAKGGKIKKAESLGRKQLTIFINKKNEYVLVSVFFNAESAVIPQIEKDLRHEQAVERFLLTTWDAEIPNSDYASRGRRARERADVQS